MTKRALLLALTALAGCDPRPARFADAPAIEAVLDDAAIPTPRRRDPVPEIRLSEAYVRRPLVNALDPARVAEGGDVNALDEVPRSSWFSPGAVEEDPPAPPFRVLPAPALTRADALAVVDARGRSFELWRDPPDRPEMATAAGAVASHLLRALGYLVPGTWAEELAWSDFSIRDPADHDAMLAFFRAGPGPRAGRFRVGVTRWPLGADLGPTPAFEMRPDDPNDRVQHPERRTLRAFGVILPWLGVSRLGPSVLRDAYAGVPGRGHVVHYVLDTSGAFGADAVVRAEAQRADDGDLAERDPWVTMGTLGLYTPRITPTQTRWPALGAYDERLPRAPFQTSPPFEPIDRLTPADAYWAAKRMVRLGPGVIEAALDAGRFSDPSARARLAAALRARRLSLVGAAFGGVTPCEVEGIVPGGQGTEATLVLRDEAVQRGFAQAASSSYRLEVIGADGAPVAGPVEVAPRTARWAVPLPARGPAYRVLRVTALRSGREAPRAVEVHVVKRREGWAVIGIRR
jgi:hypothetical protein